MSRGESDSADAEVVSSTSEAAEPFPHHFGTAGTAASLHRAPAAARFERRPVLSIGLALVAPSLIVFGIFLVLPLVSVLLLSVLHWAGYKLGDWTFAGIDNFAQMASDPIFWKSSLNTVLFTVVTAVLLNIFGFGFALLVASKVPGYRFARSVLFIPVLISPVIIGLMWSRILDAFGAINQLITLFDPIAQPVLFLGSPQLALPSIILATIWQYAGYNMLLYYAGLQKIPTEHLEAASLDGAGHVASIMHVILPGLYPVMGTVVLLNVIGGLRVFDIVYVMTSGGPDRSSEVMATYMYQQAFKFSDMGYASAIAVVVVVISIAAAVLRLRLGTLR